MKIIKLFILAVFFLSIFIGCGKSPEDARKELGQMGIKYDKDGFSECVYKGDAIAVKLFLEAGMDPNTEIGMYNDDYKGSSALFYAVCYNHKEVVKVLIDKGADVNKIGEIYLYNGSQKRSPLNQALKKNNSEIVELLKKAGAKELDETSR